MRSMELVSDVAERRPLITYLLPFTLIGIMGSAVTVLRGIFNTEARWSIFVVLTVYMLTRNNLIRYFSARQTILLALYVVWSFLTSFWSEAPLLSFLKSSLLILVAFTMTYAGVEWVKSRNWREALNYLFIIAVISMGSGFFGRYASGDASQVQLSKGQFMYQGLANGSNMFGFMMALTFPYLLWKLYQSFINKKHRIILSFLTISCLSYLFMSLSRSSMLIVIAIVFGFLLSLNLTKKISLLLIVSALLFTATIVYPPAFNVMADKISGIVFKSNKFNLFYSRQQNWDISYESAMEGGLFGLGYGVSWRQTEYVFGERFFGREKGNSQLAIMEETGVVGLIFYTLLLTSIFLDGLLLFFKTKDREQKILIGIVLGSYVGFIFHSVFEAWWTSPGSQESNLFWLLVGILRGLEFVVKGKQNNYVPINIEAQNQPVLAIEHAE